MRLKTAAVTLIAAGAVFAGCGEEEDCGVTASGTELCGGSAAAYCDLIDGTNPERQDAGTREFCAELGEKYVSSP